MAKRRALLLVLLVLLVPVPARADNVADAEELFRRAKALTNADKPAEACPLFKESYRLDPAQGTLLNLALCNEKIGAIGTAWGQLRAVEQQARSATPPRADRADLAKQHADKLEPRLSRIRLDVPEEARVPGLVIKVDGEQKGEPLWATGIVVDPGTRTIEASAPGKKTAQVRVKIDDEGVVQSVRLQPLADAPVAATTSTTDLAEVERYAAGRARRTAGFVIGGFGVVSLAVGAGFGIAAAINNADAKRCGPPCYIGSNEARDSNFATDRAFTFANIANVTVPLGLVAGAVGTYLVVTAGPTSKVAVVPRGSSSSAGLDVVGRW